MAAIMLFSMHCTLFILMITDICENIHLQATVVCVYVLLHTVLSSVIIKNVWPDGLVTQTVTHQGTQPL